MASIWGICSFGSGAEAFCEIRTDPISKKDVEKHCHNYLFDHEGCVVVMTVTEASQLAGRAHAGQTDKAGRLYVEHVLAVRDLLADRGEHARTAGVLHGVLGDTTVTVDEPRAHGCPESVIRVVEAVTHRPAETYEDCLRRSAADPLGRPVKMADNEHNSDEERLAALPAAQTERLRAKYARARSILRASERSRYR